MRDKGTERWGTYEPFHIMLNGFRVADIIISGHAKARYLDRIAGEAGGQTEIAAWMWQCLMQKRIKPYGEAQRDAYLIDDDVVVIAEFRELPEEQTVAGDSLYAMVVVSFLGQTSRIPQLQDLTAYYARLRQNRQMKLMKKKRKRRQR